MADEGFELVVNSNHIPQYLSRLDAAIDLGMDTWAGETLQEAKAEAPTDTGGLRASGFRITGVTNEYGAAVAAFTARNRKGKPGPEPTIDRAEHEIAIGFAADYARPVNDGHHTRGGSFVGGTGFLTRPLEGNIGRIRESIANALDKINP